MTNDEARDHLGLALRATGQALIYEGRERSGYRRAPNLLLMDPDTGVVSRVRVMVGKDPRGKRMYFDRGRVGDHADVIALVHPATGAVEFRAA